MYSFTNFRAGAAALRQVGVMLVHKRKVGLLPGNIERRGGGIVTFKWKVNGRIAPPTLTLPIRMLFMIWFTKLKLGPPYHDQT